MVLHVLDARMAVVAYGRDRNSSFKCSGDPGVSEGIPSQFLA